MSATHPHFPTSPLPGFAGLDPCVHCGFCLPACPTYEVTADEADSPRGRIVLMRALARGEMSPHDAGLQAHLDRCLGCRGCESVCPSGVIFGPALEASRAIIATEARPLPPALRLALWVLARPERQGVLWLLSRMLRASGLPRRLARSAGLEGPLAARMMAMLAATRLSRWDGGTAAVAPAPSGPATLFRGCVMNGLFSHVHDATIVALGCNGLSVAPVAGEVCCGALAAHAGAHQVAVDLARENVAALARSEGPIVVNSAGCGAMLRSYGELLAGDPMEAEARRVAARVRDVSEVLAECGPRPGRRPVPLRIAYDAPCHLVHAQKIAAAPLRLLGALPGATLVPLEGSERCCGSAGLYAMMEPGLSSDVLASKLDAIRRAAPDLVVTGNPGCVMQIGAGLLLDGQRVDVCHPVELLAWSYRA